MLINMDYLSAHDVENLMKVVAVFNLDNNRTGGDNEVRLMAENNYLEIVASPRECGVIAEMLDNADEPLLAELIAPWDDDLPHPLIPDRVDDEVKCYSATSAWRSELPSPTDEQDLTREFGLEDETLTEATEQMSLFNQWRSAVSDTRLEPEY